jgi:hypothetical protein
MQTGSETEMPSTHRNIELYNALQSFFVDAYSSWHSPEQCQTDLYDALNSAWCTFIGSVWQKSCEHGQTYDRLKGPIGELYLRYSSVVNEWLTTAKVVEYIRRDLRSPGNANPSPVLLSDLQILSQTILWLIEHRGLQTQEQESNAGHT